MKNAASAGFVLGQPQILILAARMARQRPDEEAQNDHYPSPSTATGFARSERLSQLTSKIPRNESHAAETLFVLTIAGHEPTDQSTALENETVVNWSVLK